jgi:hypothetical protein
MLDRPARTGSLGSHPHSDRPNWRPAETADEYLANCREGLEEYSERRVAKLLGMSRMRLWRAGLMGEIPDKLFELILATAKREKIKVSTKMLAYVGQALRTWNVGRDVECCPNCGHVLRVRRHIHPKVVECINAWIADRGND